MSAEFESAFARGSQVRVSLSNPPGHRRTPFYIRGKVGVIERDCGRHLNPEDLAYGWSGKPMKRLYRVRFRQIDIWPRYRGNLADTVDVDLYEHWLAPASTSYF